MVSLAPPTLKDHARTNQPQPVRLREAGGSSYAPPPMPASPRLGFAVRVVGQPSLRSHAPRAAAQQQLGLGLLMLRDILHYLQHQQISYYRLDPALLPLHDLALAWSQLAAQQATLAVLADQIAQQQVRLTLHAGPHVVLGTADPALARASQAELTLLAALLEALHPDPSGCIVVHVGGSSGPAARRASLEQFATHYTQLPAAVRRRVVVEHDHAGFDLADLLWLHQQCGVAIVFDYLHWLLHDQHALPLALALGLATATWARGVRPEVHLSTARTEAHLLPPQGKQPARVLAPRHGQHADFVSPHDLLAVLHAGRSLPPFDLLLEAKAGDLAVLRLRQTLARYQAAAGSG